MGDAPLTPSTLPTVSLPQRSTGLPSRTPRNLAIGAGVAALHLGVLWALQGALVRRPPEVLVPVELISEVITPAAMPRVVQAPPAPPPPAPPQRPIPAPPSPPAKQLATALPNPSAAAAPLPLAPQPMASPEPALVPAPVAPVGVAAPQPAPAPLAAPVTAAPAVAPSIAPAPAPVQLPSSDADYLRNPKPAYPPVSKRLGEQGKVVVRVLIGADGTAQRAEIRQSSGFDRLDHAALDTALKWRYVPGKRGGVPEAMWFNVPINFVLE